MNTVILKWNPAFSSYSMLAYLSDIRNANFYDEFDYNWSVWDYDKIHIGDRFYWLKVGRYGQTGIVGCGTITSEPYTGEDWSGQGHKTYYVDLSPEIMVNPDALPILTTEELQHAIPDFQWDGGHSGLILNQGQAEKLDALWEQYVKAHTAEFEKAASLNRGDKDLVYSKEYNDARIKEKEEDKPIEDSTEELSRLDKIRNDAEKGMWDEDARDLIDGFDLINGKVGSFHDSEVIGLDINHEEDYLTLKLHMCNGANHLLVLRFEGNIYYDRLCADGYVYLHFGYFYYQNDFVTLDLEGYGEIAAKRIKVVSVEEWKE